MIVRFHYDRTQLQAFLDNQTAGDIKAIQSHLESCEDCQTELERLVQSNFDWEQATRLLNKPVEKSSEKIEVDSKTLPEYSLSFLTPSEHPDSLGRLARFEIMEVLGRGGMGIVLRGLDTSLNRHSAIKVLVPELASSAAARKRFSREAKSAAAVVHPHVVPIQTVDEHNGLPYLVMPVVEGQSLQQRVDRSGPLSVIETVRIASQVASGLQAAHEQGLVHRDIKPANILLENGVERVQITDFGLARAVDDASMTRSGVVTGTPQYMSPEQAHGDTIDHRSDLFSLGSLIYFMLVARSPFRAETTMGVLNRIAHDIPRSLCSINPDVPQWLEQIVMKLLAKSRSDRYQTASEVGQLLRDWHLKLQQPEAFSPPAPENQSRPLRVVDPIARNHDTVSSLPVAPESVDLISLQQPVLSQPAASARDGGSTINPSNHLKSTKQLAAGSNGGVKRWLIAIGACAFLFLCGILITVETNKGTLIIQCEAEDVPIRIMQGTKIVEQLTVTREGKSIRIAAGNYVVEVAQALEGISIAGGEVTLKRGDVETVNIKLNANSMPAKEMAEISSQPEYESDVNASNSKSVEATPASLSLNERLRGNWEMVRAADDMNISEATENQYITFKDQFTAVWGADGVAEDTFLFFLNESLYPPHIDFFEIAPGNANHLVGLITVDEDTLKIAISKDQQRPAKVEATQGVIYSEYRRTTKLGESNTDLDEKSLDESPSTLPKISEAVTKHRVMFSTPEILMNHYADCQMRGDEIGCFDCCSDEVMYSLAASTLMSASMIRSDMLFTDAERKNAITPPETEKFLKELDALLKASTIDNPPAIASLALHQATDTYLKLSDKDKRDAITDDQTALIAMSPTMLKDPIQFVKDFVRLAAPIEYKMSPKPLPTNRKYRIEYEGEKVFAVNDEDGRRMGLQCFDGNWLIDALWANAKTEKSEDE